MNTYDYNEHMTSGLYGGGPDDKIFIDEGLDRYNEDNIPKKDENVKFDPKQTEDKNVKLKNIIPETNNEGETIIRSVKNVISNINENISPKFNLIKFNSVFTSVLSLVLIYSFYVNKRQNLVIPNFLAFFILGMSIYPQFFISIAVLAYVVTYYKKESKTIYISMSFVAIASIALMFLDSEILSPLSSCIQFFLLICMFLLMKMEINYYSQNQPSPTKEEDDASKNDENERKQKNNFDMNELFGDTVGGLNKFNEEDLPEDYNHEDAWNREKISELYDKDGDGFSDFGEGGEENYCVRDNDEEYEDGDEDKVSYIEFDFNASGGGESVEENSNYDYNCAGNDRDSDFSGEEDL